MVLRPSESNIAEGVKALARLSDDSNVRLVNVTRDGHTVLDYDGTGGPDVNASVHFPCGLPSTFSLTFRLRLNRADLRRARGWVPVFALFNVQTQSALLRVAVSGRRRGRLQVESDLWKHHFPRKSQWPKFSIEGLTDGAWHTITLRIDNNVAEAYLDCLRNGSRRRLLPAIIAVTPEEIGKVLVLVGKGNPQTPWTTDEFKVRENKSIFYHRARVSHKT